MSEPAAGEGKGAGAAENGARAHVIIQVAGEGTPRTHPVSDAGTTIGRDSRCDVVLPLEWLSRFQLSLRTDGNVVVVDRGPGATLAVQHQGRVLDGPVMVEHADLFRVAGEEPGEMVTFIVVPVDEVAAPDGRVVLGEGESLLVGSDADADIGAGNVGLAERHARIRREGGAYTLEDLGHGVTMVDGRTVEGSVALPDGTSVSVGSIRLRVTGDALHARDALAGVIAPRRRAREIPDDLRLSAGATTGGVTIEARQLQKTVGKGVTILSDVSLRIQPRELVVLVGLSGSGKTTLLNALAGYRQADSGDVRFDGVDLYQNFDEFRSSIGYVPQKDIVHSQLTVHEAFDYACRLRLPKGTSKQDRETRITQVLTDLGLEERRDTPVRELSGGQVKRVSIGVELISNPEVLFLDEPTSGLDPVTETGLMQLLRGLADQGRTIVVITHATKNVMLADKVIFLVPGGRVAFFGPPWEALDYFARYRSEAERSDRAMEFDAIYRVLEDRSLGTPDEWATRYRQDTAHDRYVAAPLKLAGEPPAASTDIPETVSDRRRRAVGMASQWKTLVARNARLLSRDKFALVLIVAAAPLLALLDFLITQRDMFDSFAGDTARIITNTNTIIVNAMLVGALSQMREIIKDRDIYRREQLVNLRIPSYVLSKVLIAAFLALYQAICWVGIRWLAVDMPGGADTFMGFYITLVLVTFAGMMLGLFASAIAPTEDSTALIVALLIVPQVLFSGAHLPAHKLNPMVEAQMDIMPSRWAFEALVTEGGHGKDIANDACWDLPREERLALTEEEKADCVCLGASIFEICEFPGIRSYAGEGIPQGDAIRLAEGRLDADVDYYGPVYDVNVGVRWGILALISLVLIAIITAIQRVRERF